MAFSLALLGASTYEKPALGSYDLLSTQILTSNTASVTFASLGTFAADYEHLQLRISARSNQAETFGSMNIRLNGDSASNYTRHELSGNGSSVASGAATTQTSMTFHIQIVGANAAANEFGANVSDFLDPFNASKNTTVRTLGGRTSSPRINLHSGLWMNTASITSIELITNSGSVITGSRFSLYGLRKV